MPSKKDESTKKKTGKGRSPSRKKSSKSKIRRKQRDTFVTNAIIVSVAALLVVAAANIYGKSNGTVGDDSTVPPADSVSAENASVPETYTDADKLCRFDFIDVGQGDSTLITTPEKEYILVDTGTTDASSLMSHLEASKVDEIDCLILTHPHNDHIGGAENVLEKYDVRQVIMPNVITTTMLFDRLYDALVREKETAGCKVYSASPGDNYTIDGCTLDIIGPLECNPEALNNCSISFVFTYGKYDALFTGDTEKDAEKELLRTGSVTDCELYKAAHHGSDTSNCIELLNVASPDICVVSCGKNNTYGHPSAAVIKRLADSDITTYITAEHGTVSVFTDGDGCSVKAGK